MRDFFIFGGRSSRDFGAYIANITQFDAPKRDVTVVEVPGRNGTLSLDNGRFKNAEHKYDLYIDGDVRENLAALRSWLMSRKGYQELKDTLNPDEFYLARFRNEVKVDSSDRAAAALSVIFDRMPQRFQDAGKIKRVVTGSAILHNRYNFEAKPLIRVYGSGSFTIGGVTVGVAAQDAYMDIDCDLEEAYKDTLSNSKNDCVTLDSGRFPVLAPGDNAVSLSGIERLDITPRWWTI